MATKDDVTRALRRAAITLAGKETLTESEGKQLTAEFDKATGTPRERGRKALREFLNISESDLQKRASASDNTDRIIKDLESVLDDWKP